MLWTIFLTEFLVRLITSLKPNQFLIANLILESSSAEEASPSTCSLAPLNFSPAFSALSPASLFAFAPACAASDAEANCARNSWIIWACSFILAFKFSIWAANSGLPSMPERVSLTFCAAFNWFVWALSSAAYLSYVLFAES